MRPMRPMGPMRPMRPMRLMGPMRPMGPMGPMRLMGLIGLMGLMGGCTSDELDGPEEPKEVSIEIMSSSAKYEEVDAVTRATTPNWMPNNYTEEHVYLAYGVFFTKSDGTVIKSKFHYGYKEDGINKTWRMTGDIGAGDYYLYGYMPYDAGEVTIEPNGTYANGAIMTFTGLNAAMTKDFCIITGAKDAIRKNQISTDPVKYEYFINDGSGNYTETWMKTGDFKCHIKAGEGDENKNILFFLFDHLYAALRLCFRVDETYNQLRDIVIKRLELESYTDEACTVLMPKLKTIVTLQATSTFESPIVGDVTFEADPSGAKMDKVLIYDNPNAKWEDRTEDNKTVNDRLPSLDQDNNKVYVEKSGYIPKSGSENYYKLTTTYDIYDKKGNLIRNDQLAVIVLNPKALFSTPQLQRGYSYTLRLTIGPTYLYQMSDDDLEFTMDIK